MGTLNKKPPPARARDRQRGSHLWMIVGIVTVLSFVTFAVLQSAQAKPKCRTTSTDLENGAGDVVCEKYCKFCTDSSDPNNIVTTGGCTVSATDKGKAAGWNDMKCAQTMGGSSNLSGSGGTAPGDLDALDSDAGFVDEGTTDELKDMPALSPTDVEETTTDKLRYKGRYKGTETELE